MKAIARLFLIGFVLTLAGVANGADNDKATATEQTPHTPSVKVAVIAPEQIGDEWFWFAWGGGRQHIVQTAVEKALIGAGYDVVDVKELGDAGNNLDKLIASKSATATAKQLGADYVIAGKATAERASQGEAYGVKVIRADATITLQLIRVADSKVLAAEESTAQEGGQALRAAGQKALRKAAKNISEAMLKAVREATGE